MILMRKLIVVVWALSGIVAELYAQCEFFYHHVGYVHSPSIRLDRCPIPSNAASDSQTVVINDNSWVLTAPGLTAVNAPCEGTTIGCAYTSYKGKAINFSLLHSLHGTPTVMQIRHNTAKGFLYSETLFLNCYFGEALAAGRTSNDSQVEIVFSLTRSGTVRVIGAVGYATALQGLPIVITRQGSYVAETYIFDITNPSETVIVYSRSSISLEPGGIYEFDDTVHLAAGRIYALYLVTASDDWVTASSETVNAPAIVSASCSGTGGTAAVITLLYDECTQSYVTPEVIRSDVNGDGCVDDADLLAVLFCFGTLVNVGEGDINLRTDCLAADVNMDGIVDDADLLTILWNMGICYGS